MGKGPTNQSPRAKRRTNAKRKPTQAADTLDLGTCVYQQGEECPNRTAVKDPSKTCAREERMRERILERARKPFDASKKVSKKELETRYCLYGDPKTLDVNREDIQEKLRK